MLELTIAAYHQSLLKHQISTECLVDFYLDRIRRFESFLSSIICVNPAAIELARECDHFLRSTGKLSGSLHGVPVLIKDNIETEDMPTTAGSLSLQGFRTGKDADLVKRLKAAGAIILAKTNLHEFAIWGESISSIKGQTYNPYDLTRTPGGSSGGTGAALAANFGLVGIGTDTINSIRSPSSANNLVGIRPTVGLVSNDGIVPYSLTQDTAGPMARSVADAVAVLKVIAIRDLPETKASGNPRIGLLKSFFGSDPINEEVNRVMACVVKELGTSGVEIVEINDQIQIGDLVSNISVHLYELKAHLNNYLKAVQAPYQSIDAILESGLHHPGIKENLVYANQLDIKAPEYGQRLVKRALLQEQIKALFTNYRLDALLFPHQQQLVCKVGESQIQRNGALSAITGFPSVCLPAGFSAATLQAPIGVPIGFELLGLPGSECRLIEISRYYEQQYPKRKPPREDNWL
ncbi:MAG TPA: amidase family protein [Anaerolineaceae bacterium]|nr:amidase family protein [Anaerolineaceae bacterium]